MEFQRALSTNDRGAIILEGDDATAENIKTWLETPVGSVPGQPEWGHTLEDIEFEPMDDEFPIIVEMIVAKKLKQDLPRINLRGIRVESTGIDSATLVFMHSGGYAVVEKQF